MIGTACALVQDDRTPDPRRKLSHDQVRAICEELRDARARNGGRAPHGFGVALADKYQITPRYMALLMVRAEPAPSKRNWNQGSANPHPHTRLTAEDIRAIRAEAKTLGHGGNLTIARRYGITPGYVSAIKAGQRWTSVPR